MRHAELRVLPFADGDGVIKAAPETAIALFRLVGLACVVRMDHRQRYDGGMTVGIKERLAVCAVIEEKGLVVAALAEVTAQKRQNAIFRLDLCGEHAANVGKTHKAAILLQLAVQLPHGTQQGMIRFIGKPLQQRLSLAVEPGGKAIDGKLFFR